MSQSAPNTQQNDKPEPYGVINFGVRKATQGREQGTPIPPPDSRVNAHKQRLNSMLMRLDIAIAQLEKREAHTTASLMQLDKMRRDHARLHAQITSAYHHVIDESELHHHDDHHHHHDAHPCGGELVGKLNKMMHERDAQMPRDSEKQHACGNRHHLWQFHCGRQHPRRVQMGSCVMGHPQLSQLCEQPIER